jgi:hypothetical protein
MAIAKGKRLQKASEAGRKPSGRTQLLGFLAGGAVLTVFGAEVTRVWRLGMLPQSREERDEREQAGRLKRSVMIMREGYAVSRTRENALFNMLASFSVTFGVTRGITWYIREHGGLGPIQNVIVGKRHIHHFIPGGLIALSAGGVAIGMKGEHLDKYLALPFGIGVALVLDESALLLELEDVYWTEEGVVSVQIVFAAMAMLSALAYLIRMLRQTEGQDAESDWEIAAKAWDDLQMIPGIGGGSAEPGIGL